MSISRAFKLPKQFLGVLKTFRNFPIFFAIRFGLVRRVSKAEAVLWNGIKYRIDLGNIDLNRQLIQEVWSNNVYDLTGEDASRARVIVDIGASIGTFSIFAGAKGKRAKVYSFEPNPKYFNLLQDNIRLNKLEGRVRPFRSVVSSTTGYRRLFLSRKSPTRNSLVGSDLLETDRERYIKVKSTTLKELFRSNQIRHCDFLKLDCEGSEFEILLNAPPSVLGRIRKISLEYHDGVTEYSHTDLAKFLEGHGFDIKIKPLDDRLGFLHAVNENTE